MKRFMIGVSALVVAVGLAACDMETGNNGGAHAHLRATCIGDGDAFF